MTFSEQPDTEISSSTPPPTINLEHNGSEPSSSIDQDPSIASTHDADPPGEDLSDADSNTPNAARSSETNLDEQPTSGSGEENGAGAATSGEDMGEENNDLEQEMVDDPADSGVDVASSSTLVVAGTSAAPIDPASVPIPAATGSPFLEVPQEIRDMIYKLQILTREYKRLFENHYSSMPREKWLKEMSYALEFQSRDFAKFFKLVGKDMDEQYLRIRKVRRALFNYDNPKIDRGCEVDAEEWRNDEKIVWDVNEPHLRPDSFRLWAIGVGLEVYT